MANHIFSRTELLIGTDNLDKLQKSKVVVFGVGGVGSFTVEALVRSGVGTLVLVDNDDICLTNINRQIHATTKTLGKSKVETMKNRILDINPDCVVITHEVFVDVNNVGVLIDKSVDYVVDAIDTVTSKLVLIEYCKKNNIDIISSMGTGNKLDPSRFMVTDIYNTSGCRLARVMRNELRKREIKECKVVFSDELPMKPHVEVAEELSKVVESTKAAKKRQTPGSISFVPPVAGMIIAGEVVRDLIK
ncbi:MAG: tRNA threonylcarbamoyladenosine dehydratase [Clostridium sp.]|uniref:tRNA threonylcarbamoyladenosine dehydratase n=1 Tax=Clostridium sp. TaxID=1506 RepID=UPI003043D558